MNFSTGYGRNPRCRQCGRRANKARVRFHGRHHASPRFRYTACQALVSARAGTAHAGIRTKRSHLPARGNRFSRGNCSPRHRALTGAR